MERSFFALAAIREFCVLGSVQDFAVPAFYSFALQYRIFGLRLLYNTNRTVNRVVSHHTTFLLTGVWSELFALATIVGFELCKPAQALPDSAFLSSALQTRVLGLHPVTNRKPLSVRDSRTYETLDDRLLESYVRLRSDCRL